MIEEKLLSSGEAARLLGVTRTTLIRWRAYGDGPRYYAAERPQRRLIRYALSDLQEFMRPADTRRA